MHKTIAQAKQFIGTLSSLVDLSQEGLVSLAVPFTALSALSEMVKQQGWALSLGAQNCGQEISGAFTGEVSAAMVKEAGAEFVLIGHSERRHLFFEKDEVIKKKVQVALQEELKVTLCVGETVEERNKGQAKRIVEGQIRTALGEVNAKWDSLVIAYEPVWAIGTGLVASVEAVEEMHAHVRQIIAALSSEATARAIPIQYGGSVTVDNVASLLGDTGKTRNVAHNVNGLLVGGASLSADTFAQIIEKSRNLI